ncbi:hypothetical protein VP01_1600g6 [Puccinia sorghi]|uniref:Uncharacterized protein n=1 Tax=Puccinia sorghi TaxID=27349 RepID=A0A0L6VHB0_9BASI|nr:hypothetical protein VP01_1600g6 [Puccinia sorghi]
MVRNIKIRVVRHVLIARFSLLSNVVSLAFHVGGEGARQEHLAGYDFEDALDRFLNGQLEPLLQSRDNWVTSEFPTDDLSLHSGQSSHHLSKPAEPRNGLANHSIAVPQQFEGSSSSPSAPLPVAAHNLEINMDHCLEPLESPPHKRLRITPEFLGDFDEISAPIENPAVAPVKLTQPGPLVNVALPTAHQNTIRKLSKDGAGTANYHKIDWVANFRLERPLTPSVISDSKEQYQRRVDSEVETSLAECDEMLKDSWPYDLISAAWLWQSDNPPPKDSTLFQQFNTKLDRKMKELNKTPLPQWSRPVNMVPEHPILMIPKSYMVQGPQDILIRIANFNNIQQGRSRSLSSISKDILSIAEWLIIYHRMGNWSNIWPSLLETGAAISENHLIDWLFGIIFEENDGSLPLLGKVKMVFPASEKRARMFGALQKYLSQVLGAPGSTRAKDIPARSLIILYAWYISSVEEQMPGTASHLHPGPFWRALTPCTLSENDRPHQLNYINSI